jgi:hypothetical protein
MATSEKEQVLQAALDRAQVAAERFIAAKTRVARIERAKELWRAADGCYRPMKALGIDTRPAKATPAKPEPQQATPEPAPEVKIAALAAKPARTRKVARAKGK